MSGYTPLTMVLKDSGSIIRGVVCLRDVVANIGASFLPTMVLLALITLSLTVISTSGVIAGRFWQYR